MKLGFNLDFRRLKMQNRGVYRNSSVYQIIEINVQTGKRNNQCDLYFA